MVVPDPPLHRSVVGASAVGFVPVLGADALDDRGVFSTAASPRRCFIRRQGNVYHHEAVIRNHQSEETSYRRPNFNHQWSLTHKGRTLS